MQTDEIDELLKMSDPASELTAKERRAAAEMVDQSMPPKRRRYARPLAVGTIAAVLLCGGGMAAAAATGLWDGWAQDDALAILHYELPSGVPCEIRIGNVQGAPDAVDDAIRDALAGAEFDDAEVASSIDNSVDPLTDDEAYENAYNWTVVAHIDEALKANGLESVKPQYSAQGNCG